MKPKTTIIVYTPSHQIKTLDSQIMKAKTKLEDLKKRRNILYAKLVMVRQALNEIKNKHKKLSNGSPTEQEDISDMLGKVLKLKIDEASSEEQIDDTLRRMTLDHNVSN